MLLAVGCGSKLRVEVRVHALQLPAAPERAVAQRAADGAGGDERLERAANKIAQLMLEPTRARASYWVGTLQPVTMDSSVGWGISPVRLS